LRGNILVFGAPTIIALWFVYSFAFPYLTPDAGQFGIYWPRHQWLYAHVLAGIAALMLGPAQFWLALNGRTAMLHRVLGVGYVMGVAVSSTAAFYLAFHTDFGWVFGTGFASMALAWVIATTLATAAIWRRQIEQHREWMIRSYVITFAFVTFRIIDVSLDLAKVGTIVERMSAASWVAWAVPLLITESILQGRKIFASPVSARQLQGAQAYNAAPEPEPFDLQNSEPTYLHQLSPAPSTLQHHQNQS
jgi:hypothetical protein